MIKRKYYRAQRNVFIGRQHSLLCSAIRAGDRGKGGAAVPPPSKWPNSGKIYLGKNHVKFGHFVIFSGIYHVKFGNFVNFSGKYHVKFGHFVNFHACILGQKCLVPLKLTELLRLCAAPCISYGQVVRLSVCLSVRPPVTRCH